jgi:hypothetical protein
VLLLRYRELVDEPIAAIARVDEFLGVAHHEARVANPENVHPFIGNTPRVRRLGRLVRAGAAAGSHFPPQLWRGAERHLLKSLHRRGIRRPRLSPESRMAALELMADDIRDLGVLTGESYADWLSPTGGGDFIGRRLPHLPQPRPAH